MKTTSTLIHGLLVCGIALATVSTAFAETKPETAKVVRLRGHARYMVAGGAWQDLHVGSLLEPGSVVQSDMEGSAYVDLLLGKGAGGFPTYGAAGANPFNPIPGAGAGGGYTASTKETVVRVFANTVLGLDKLTVTETGAATVTDTELDLRQGRIVANVKKQSPGSDFRIRYAKGVARIHGSILDMNVNKSEAPDQTQVTFGMALGTGEVTFSGTGYTVPPGYMFQAPPPAVVQMPAALPGELLTLGYEILPQPVVVTRVPDPGQTEIQFVTGTGGGPKPKPGDRPE